MTMRQARNYSLFLLLASSPTFLLGHGVHTGEESAHHGVDTAVAVRAALPFAGISGQGDLKFRVLYAEDHLPAKAVEVLRKAHGGFAVDRREGRGETYFALPGAGIVRLSADLRTASPIETDASMKDVNLHNTTIWYSAGEAYLTFPANGAGKVFTTKLDGTLVHTLEISGGRNNFGDTGVNEYFKNQGKFAPTDVEHLGNLLYVTTGYSQLDYVSNGQDLEHSSVQSCLEQSHLRREGKRARQVRHRSWDYSTAGRGTPGYLGPAELSGGSVHALRKLPRLRRAAKRDPFLATSIM